MNWRICALAILLSGVIVVSLCMNPPVAKGDLNKFFSTQIYDKNGVLIREIPSPLGAYGRYTPLEEISPNVITATIFAEDKRFFGHTGIDFIATVRSLVQNIKGLRTVSGASTISQQVIRIAKNRPRTFISKIETMLESMWLTISTSKRQQLEYYLNLASYGADGVGIKEAANRYFRSSPKNLTLAQAAFLAVIPRSPKRLNPVANFAAVKMRQEDLLRRLYHYGSVSKEFYNQAMSETIKIDSPPSRPFLAPHFTEYIRANFDLSKTDKISTTLNLAWQKEVETLVKHHLERTERHRINNAAVIVIDNQTHGVVSWVGSGDYFDTEHNGAVDGVIARRQPGSAMKPFMYALALGDNMTAASILPDIRTHYALDEDEYYIPRNYNKEYHGPVRLREALAGSLNVPAVYVAKIVGPAKIEGILNRMGFGLENSPWHYGLGIALGNPEIRLIDLAGAYSMLANGGMWQEISLFPSANETPLDRIVDPEVAAIITDILSDTDTRDQFFGIQNPFHFDFPAAIKTGTSSNWKDNWSFGYTKDVTVGVWVGNFDAEPMQGTSGATGAGPLLRDVLEFVANKYPARREIVSKVALKEGIICPLSGLKAGPNCPTRTVEYFIAGTEVTKECDWHRMQKIDTRNNLMAGESCPRRFVAEEMGVLYPAEFRNWASEHGVGINGYSPLCSDRPIVETIAIAHPKNGAKFLIDPTRHLEFQTIPLKATIEGNPREVDWILDGALYQSVRENPFTANYKLSTGRHTLIARSAGMESMPVMFEVK